MTLSKILEIAKHSKGITIRELISKASEKFGWNRGQVRLQTIKALREGYLRILEANVDFEESTVEATEKEPTEETFEIPKTMESIIEAPTKLKEIESEVNIVATVPDRLKNICHATIRYNELLDAFSDMIHQANKTIRLSLPFLEPNGIWIFFDDIVAAASKGVEFKLLTREVYEPQENVTWVRKVKALIKLVELFRRYGSGGEKQIEIRDFHTTVMARDLKYQFESSHAKIIIADESIAYVGSGEWRENSLFYNFEVGVVLKGSAVQNLVRLFDIVWEHSKEVTYEVLKTHVM